MEVPANNNSPSGRPKPDDAYLMMAAASMYQQGRLTKEQRQERAAAGPEFGETLDAYHDVGAAFPHGVKIEGQRRSENVEEAPQSMAEKSDREAEALKARYQNAGVYLLRGKLPMKASKMTEGMDIK